LTEDQFYKLQDVLINPFPFSVMVKPRKTCEESVHSVILVHSTFDNFKKRTAIRSTWGSTVNKSFIWPRVGPLNHSMALFFVFGKYKDESKNDGIYEENLEFGDIVQGNFVDSYKNMTLKSLLDFKFIIEFCSMAKFLIKSDDDMFINLPFLLNEMDEMPKRSIMGALCVGSKTRRFGKWLITKEEFPFETYPTYEAGATYVITRDLWEDIFNASYFVPYIFIDDVYITGIIGKILNVTHVSKNK
ncbi:hypothetical protein HELRODRAFT_123705, partial [Helobdella robusta]|uniref:Hexosyltransferase n=1 Tax=Helobdella robusta TaxID=6412 RepID=T1EGY6_HELRO